MLYASAQWEELWLEPQAEVPHLPQTGAQPAYQVEKALYVQEVRVPGSSRSVQPSLTEKLEKLKASVRAKVEQPFRVIKQQFGHAKVSYTGLAKNTAQLAMLFALGNLWMARRQILEMRR